MHYNLQIYYTINTIVILKNCIIHSVTPGLDIKLSHYTTLNIYTASNAM